MVKPPISHVFTFCLFSSRHKHISSFTANVYEASVVIAFLNVHLCVLVFIFASFLIHFFFHVRMQYAFHFSSDLFYSSKLQFFFAGISFIVYLQNFAYSLTLIVQFSGSTEHRTRLHFTLPSTTDVYVLLLL